MTDVTSQYESAGSPAGDQEEPADDVRGVVPEMRDQDPDETESQQLIDPIPDALPTYIKIELRRRSPEEQVLYLLAKLAESRADLVKECAGSAKLRQELTTARTAYLVQGTELAELAQARILWTQWEASSQEIMAAQLAEIARLEAALGAAREEVDAEIERAQSWQRWGEGHKRRADQAPDAVAALQVKPGDRVAVLVPGDVGDDFHGQLKALFPGVDIVLLTGVAGMIRMGA